MAKLGKTKLKAAGEHWLPFPNFILKSDVNAETAQLHAELTVKLRGLQEQTTKKLKQMNQIAEKGFSGKIFTPPVYEGSPRHPLDSPNTLTDKEDESRKERYTAAKEKYNRELAAALKQDKEARDFIDQLRQEVGALELEKRSLLQLFDAIKYSKMRPKIFGAEQLLKYNDQQQEVLLGVLMDGKQAIIQEHYSTDVRLICELFEKGFPVQLA
jgi:hypothetical protein